jgi:RNA polymerase sigma-70 factor (ECF subfamily)
MMNEETESDVAATDAELVQQTLDGDRRAFGVLVERHQKQIFALVSKLIRDQNEVEDVAQECFIRAYKALGTFRGDAQFSTWVYRIVYNTCLTRREQQARRQDREISMFAENEQADDQPREFEDEDGPLPDEVFEATDVRERLLKHLENMPVHYRAVLVLYYYEERSYQEIADALDLPMNTVKVHLLRAKKRLKKLLTESDASEEWEREA